MGEISNMMFISHQPIHQFGVTASPVLLLEGWRSASQALAKCAWTVLDCGFLWKWPDSFPHPGKIWNNKSRADLHQVCHPSLGWRADSHTCPRGLMAGLTWWTDKECPLWAGPGVASGRPRRRHMPSHLGKTERLTTSDVVLFQQKVEWLTPPDIVENVMLVHSNGSLRKNCI